MQNPFARKGNGFLAIIAIAILLAGVYVYTGGKFLSPYNPALNPLSSLGGNTSSTLGGITALSLQNVQYVGINQGNFSGNYILSTFLANQGPESYIGNPTSSQIAASAASSLIGTSQNIPISIGVQQNQLRYYAGGNEQILYVYSLMPYTGTLSYTNCAGQQVSNINGQTPQTFSLCILSSQISATHQSYVNACKSAASTQNGSISGVTLNQGGYVCYVAKRQLFGYVYSLGSAPQVYQQVTASWNGHQLVVNTGSNYAVHTNSSGKVDFALTLLPSMNGKVSGPNVAIGDLYVPANQTAPSLLGTGAFYTLGSVSTQGLNAVNNNITSQNNCLSQTVTNCGTTLSQLQGNFQSINNRYQTKLITLNASQITASSIQLGEYLTSPLNIYAQTISSWTGTKLVSDISTGQDLVVIINDTNQNYATPYAKMAAGFASMGIGLAKPSCQITAVSPVTFRSGGIGNATVSLRNNATVGGTCYTNLDARNTTSNIAQTNGQVATYISAGGTGTAVIRLQSTIAFNQTGFTGTAWYASCDHVLNQCSRLQGSVTVQPNCKNGTSVSGTTCQQNQQVITPTTTTTIPAQCGGPLQPSCNATTTTIPAGPTCDPGTYFNQTLYNEHVNPPCSPNPPAGQPLPWTYIIIGIVALAIIAL
ncbi:MAG: hypothetical protein KGH62_02110, partial [Candidatus Micrarchaeota archaeon]|nr:hypothetical protein [Candidatus Micrarchaeota archaeon]